MAVEIIANNTAAVLVCNTTDTAFGPLFTDHTEAEDFLAWLSKDGQGVARRLWHSPVLGTDGRDPRDWTTDQLSELVAIYRQEP